MGSYTEENSTESQTFVEKPIGDWRKLYSSRHGCGGASVEYPTAVTRSVFQGAVGAFWASTAPAASTGPIRMRQDRRVVGLQSTRE